ncbi:hypothetical protein LCGC14_0276130 [marine sediment metagenome]|uniref:Uncharacterized protein n=1 Tax=marine sediment metagenome TaxID=412755 RepID=A0A0F9WIM7_9ZZZZ
MENPSHPTMKELKGLLNEQADLMHHNASLSSMLPTMNYYGEEIDNRFDGRLANYVEHILLVDLSYRMKGKFGIDLTFRQYGRGGATIAPTEWVVEGYGIMTEYSGLDGDTAIEELLPFYCEDQTNLSRYHAMRKLLLILEYINDYWTEQVKHCSEWWDQEVECMQETA